MLESVIDWVGVTVFWVSVGVVVGWQFPQPAWAVWAQVQLINGYKWAKAQLRG